MRDGRWRYENDTLPKALQKEKKKIGTELVHDFAVRCHSGSEQARLAHLEQRRRSLIILEIQSEFPFNFLRRARYGIGCSQSEMGRERIEARRT